MRAVLVVQRSRVSSFFATPPILCPCTTSPCSSRSPTCGVLMFALPCKPYATGTPPRVHPLQRVPLPKVRGHGSLTQLRSSITFIRPRYELKPCSTTSDSVCALVSQCGATARFQLSRPTLTTDRTCTAVGNPCIQGTTFLSTAPTSTSSAVCTPVALCSGATPFEEAPPTLTSDRRCRPETVCKSHSQYESAPLTPTTDRVCSDCAPRCPPNEYEAKPCGATSNRVCVNATTCQPPMDFQVVAATATSDAVCKAATLCLSGWFERAAPTFTTDRMCSLCRGPCRQPTQCVSLNLIFSLCLFVYLGFRDLLFLV
jgi:hypothetical protein